MKGFLIPMRGSERLARSRDALDALFLIPMRGSEVFDRRHCKACLAGS